MTERSRLLLVEDDQDLGRMLAGLLGDEGYAVTYVNSGQEALHRGLTQDFDVLVLDRGLPVIDGLHVVSTLRERGIYTPVLILSAFGNPADRVDGLDAGAEDYLSKPFDVDELLARIRALLRRRGSSAHVFNVGGGTVNRDNHTATPTGGHEIQLSEREFALLEELARNPDRVFTRAEILEFAFPSAEDPGVVDTYVHYLRRKLGRGSVRTVHGLGYRMGAIS
jgi:two-component system, OmpR family, response regulator QseB